MGHPILQIEKVAYIYDFVLEQLAKQLILVYIN